MKPRPLLTCRVFFGLFTRTKFIRIYGTVMQQSLFIKSQKCTCTCGGWSIFTEKCTPDVLTTSIRNHYKCDCILSSKMKRSIVILSSRFKWKFIYFLSTQLTVYPDIPSTTNTQFCQIASKIQLTIMVATYVYESE